MTTGRSTAVAGIRTPRVWRGSFPGRSDDRGADPVAGVGAGHPDGRIRDGDEPMIREQDSVIVPGGRIGVVTSRRELYGTCIVHVGPGTGEDDYELFDTDQLSLNR
jgi:hypothetical protein